MKFLAETKLKLIRGFTLIELLVVIGIISVLSTVVLYNYRSFGDTVLVSNLAYDIGQSIREAQNYGLASREGGGSTYFGNAYGIRFGPMDINGTATHYMFFYDIDGNGQYTGTNSGASTCPTGSPHRGGGVSTEECTKVYTITGGNKISQLCVIGGECVSNSNKQPLYFDIVFKRPSPDAMIYDYQGSAGSSEGKPISITVSNASGSVTKSVRVTQTGQISIQLQ